MKSSNLLWRVLFFASAILILLIVFSFSMAISQLVNQPHTREVNLYKSIPVDTKLLELDKRALDEAYHNHLIRLWGVWLADGARGADRISNGLRIARESYRQASEQIAKREQELQR